MNKILKLSLLSLALVCSAMLALAQEPFIGTTTSSGTCPHTESNPHTVIFYAAGGNVLNATDWHVTPATGVVITPTKTSSNPDRYNNAKFTFASPGIYQIYATVVAPDGSTKNAYYKHSDGTSNFPIYSYVTPSVSIAANKTTICGNGQESITFTATPTNGGTGPSYQWRINGVNVNGANGSTWTTSALSNGDKVTVSMYSKVMCPSVNGVVSNEIPVTVTTPKTATITVSSSTTNICDGAGFNITASTQNAGSSGTIEWKIKRPGYTTWEDAKVSDVNMGPSYLIYTTFPYPANTQFQAILKPSDCAAPYPAYSDIITVTFKQKDYFSVGITNSPHLPNTPYCADEISFKASTNYPAASFYWYKKENGSTVENMVQTGDTYDPVFIAQGDVIRVEATAVANTCLNNTTAGTTAYFNISPDVSASNLTCNICSTNPIVRCQNDPTTTTQFSISTTGSPTSVVWSIKNTLPNGTESTANTIDQTGKVTWSSTFEGTADISVKVEGCGPDIPPLTKRVIIKKAYAQPTVEIEGPPFICVNPFPAGSKVEFWARNATNVGTSPSYEFKIDNGDPTGYIPYPSPTSGGMAFTSWAYSNGVEVKVRVKNNDGCVAGGGYSSWKAINVFTSPLYAVEILPSMLDLCQGNSTTQCSLNVINNNFKLTTDKFDWAIVQNGTSTISDNGLITWRDNTKDAVTVKAWPEGCAAAAVTRSYTIKPGPNPFPDETLPVASNWEVINMNAPVSGSTIKWYDQNNVFKHTGPSFTAGPIYTPGNYYFQIEQIGENGCPSIRKSKFNITITDQFDTKLNRVETKRFDAQGNVIAHAMTYFDNAGYALQTQTKDITNGKVILTQSLKDRYDREVAAVLPAPGKYSTFSYQLNFVGSTERSGPYTYQDFDTPLRIDHPSAVNKSSDGTLGWYYSSNNTVNGKVPESKYPYSRNDYYEDGSDEIRRSASPGDEHRTGMNHERFSGSFPVYSELTDYISRRSTAIPTIVHDGNLSKEGLQSVSRDENGMFSISITDKEGKTVLTARRADAASAVLTIVNAAEITIAEPMVYFYLLHPQVVSISGTGSCYFQDLISGDVFNATDISGNWEPGFYRAVLNSAPNATVSNFKINYINYFKDVAYYFYDDAGRLRAAVSPNGLIKWKGATSYSLVDHTEYKYDHEGRLLNIEEPDAGESEFLYRNDGQIRFSKNKEQGYSRFSFTNYDRAGRPIKSGEYKGDEYDFANLKNQLEYGDQVDFPAADVNFLIETHYDFPDVSIPDLPATFKQEYIHGAVSWTQNANNKTWYSYDEYGRVKWMAQRPSILDRTFLTEYTYDFRGNLLVARNASYLGGVVIDQFYHHYEYDLDQRLKKVFTSMDGTSLRLRASYTYYLHGPLKRVELGDGIQGVDFVYNINGWLTQINHPVKANDPGNDGNDAFGMIIEYYEKSLLNLISANQDPMDFNDPIKFHQIPMECSIASHVINEDATGTGNLAMLRESVEDVKQFYSRSQNR
jgi:hypothetical protein